jgi:hypothetical protein
MNNETAPASTREFAALLAYTLAAVALIILLVHLTQQF